MNNSITVNSTLHLTTGFTTQAAEWFNSKPHLHKNKTVKDSLSTNLSTTAQVTFKVFSQNHQASNKSCQIEKSKRESLGQICSWADNSRSKEKLAWAILSIQAKPRTLRGRSI